MDFLLRTWHKTPFSRKTPEEFNDLCIVSVFSPQCQTGLIWSAAIHCRFAELCEAFLFVFSPDHPPPSFPRSARELAEWPFHGSESVSRITKKA
jgi:hypothetical protein